MSSSGDSAVADLRIICGPTAAGKSAVAMTLAERHGLAIVSADSRQIYRGFDVGTAKPNAAERARVTHQGIDVADPTERWSAGRWAAAAAAWIDGPDAGSAVVVGGTGFYLRALVEPLADAPYLDPARRAALEAELARLPTPVLRAWTETLDAPRAHLGRVQLLRALEVALLTGRRLSDSHTSQASVPRRARWLVVDPGEHLALQIAGRLDAMFARGWVDEVRALQESVPPGAPAWQACGYDALRRVAEGTLGLPEAREAILVQTRQYAKRQRTWFRHQLPAGRVTRVDPRDPRCDALVEKWWNAGVTE